MGEVRNAYEILVESREGKIKLGGPERREEEDIKLYLKRTGCENLNWVVWLRIRSSGMLL
jgi:hypothetical protein